MPNDAPITRTGTTRLSRYVGFRVAMEAYLAATVHGADERLLADLWGIVQRQAVAAEIALADAERPMVIQ